MQSNGAAGLTGGCVPHQTLPLSEAPKRYPPKVNWFPAPARLISECLLRTARPPRWLLDRHLLFDNDEPQSLPCESTHSAEGVLTGNKRERRQLPIGGKRSPHCDHANDRGRSARRDSKSLLFDKIALQRINYDRASCGTHLTTATSLRDGSSPIWASAVGP
jgi:hypothetical protein